MAQLFISYSRKDTVYIGAIREALRALGDRAEIFLDTRDIHAGDEWQRVLWDALHGSDIVLACLSVNYFASEWCARELDEALRTGALVIPCRVHDVEIDRRHPVRDIQLALGGRPFSGGYDDLARRSEWLASLVSQIRRRLMDPDEGLDTEPPGGRPGHVSAELAGAVPLLVSEARRQWAPEEVALVSVRGTADRLAVTTVVHGRTVAQVETSAAALDEALLERVGHTAADLPGQLAADAPGWGKKRLLALGEALFDWLIPASVRGPLLAAIPGAPLLPAAARLRVILSLSPPSLDRLPWRLIAFQQRFLQGEGGWTVELRPPDARVQARVDLSAPEQVLLIAPVCSRADGLAPEWFEATLAKRLKEAWRKDDLRFLRCARHRDEILDAREVRPSVIVVHARFIPGAPSRVVVDGPDRGTRQVTLPELAELAPGGKLLVLDGPGSDAVGTASFERWPVVATRGVSGTAWQGATATIDWIEAIARHGCDPVAATAYPPIAPETLLARATQRVFTGFSIWHTMKMDHPEVRKSALQVMDRKTQRSNAWDRVRELADSGEFRVLNLVGFGGDAEDHLEELGNQIDFQIRTETAKLKDLAVPRDALEHMTLTAEPLEQALADGLQQVGLGPEALARRTKDNRDRGRRTVFFLDFGTVDVKDPASPALRAWAVFAHTHLALWCPDHARIVSFVAVRCPARIEGDLHELVHDAEPAPPGRPMATVQADFLPRLGRVSRADIENYLARTECSCPKTELKRVARELHRRTHEGVFAEVIAAVELAERDGWRSLVHDSRP